MPWFKVDDNLAFHAKAVAAGNPAMGLWVRAGAWSAQQLTDGFVPDHMLAALGTAQQSERLVVARLWERVPGGIRFHEWETRQPSRVDVEAERDAARERMRKHREARKKGSAQVSDSGSESVRPNNSVRSEDVRQPRPDPTRPDPTSTDVAVPKRASQMPGEWTPSTKHVELAQSLGVNLPAEAEQFKDHHAARGSTFKDWDRAFNTWLRNAKKFSRTNGRNGVDWEAAMERARMRDGGAQ